MVRKILYGCVAVVVLMFWGGNVFASSADHLEKELESLKERLNLLENKSVTESKGLLSDLVIGGGITLVLQNAQNANAEDDSLYNGKTPTVASYSVDLGFEKTFDENNKMFMHLETGQGSIESQLKVFSNVNRDSDESDAVISVTEAWYEHAFGGTGFKLNAGKIDATVGMDENAYANDETEQFLGNIFRNSSAIDLPDYNSFGLKLAFESDKVDFTVQYLSADGLWQDVTKNIFVSGQINLKPAWIQDKSGNYRLYGWTNTKQYTKWTDPYETDCKNYGFGISFDQQLSDLAGVFARYGWEDQKVYFDADPSVSGDDVSLSQSWSLGVQFMPALLSTDDVFALAYGQVTPSSDYKEVNGLNGEMENHIEIYYKWQVNDYLSITPDVHIIQNPFGKDASNGDSTIFVSGIRTQIKF
ncbi:MAG: carbohydrate porin [Endomicrobiaceae bacterium]|nr:carbohydrate porin [Endomicrobiaceae bacterium]